MQLSLRVTFQAHHFSLTAWTCGTEFHVLILHVVGLVLEQKKADSFMAVKTVVYLCYSLHSPRIKQNGMR